MDLLDLYLSGVQWYNFLYTRFRCPVLLAFYFRASYHINIVQLFFYPLNLLFFFHFSPQRLHSARPVNSNSLAFLVTGIYIFCLFLHYVFAIICVIDINFRYCIFYVSFIAIHDSKLTPDVP